MNASAPIPESRPTDDKANEPSMEDILASIRRIIADDQVLPLTQRPAPAPPKPGAGNGSPRPARDDVSPPARERGREPSSLRPVAPGPATIPAPVTRGGHGEESRSRLDPLTRRQDDPARAEEAAGRRRPELDDPAALNANLAARLRSVIDRERPRDEPVRPSVPTAPAPREIPYGEEEPRPDQAGKLLSPSAQASVASSFQALAATTSHETIDSTVREMLRPMLTQWLDDNLPSLVERLVRAEIERVARGGR